MLVGRKHTDNFQHSKKASIPSDAATCPTCRRRFRYSTFFLTLNTCTLFLDTMDARISVVFQTMSERKRNVLYGRSAFQRGCEGYYFFTQTHRLSCLEFHVHSVVCQRLLVFLHEDLSRVLWHLSHSVADSWPNTFWHQLLAHSHILNCSSTAHPPDVSGRSIVFF